MTRIRRPRQRRRRQDANRVNVRRQEGNAGWKPSRLKRVSYLQATDSHRRGAAVTIDTAPIYSFVDIRPDPQSLWSVRGMIWPSLACSYPRVLLNKDELRRECARW